jgi:hypothetical protein
MAWLKLSQSLNILFKVETNTSKRIQIHARLFSNKVRAYSDRKITKTSISYVKTIQFKNSSETAVWPISEFGSNVFCDIQAENILKSMVFLVKIAKQNGNF